MLSEGARRLLAHFSRHLVSVGHPDVAREIGALVGYDPTPTPEGEGYSDAWHKPETAFAGLLELA